MQFSLFAQYAAFIALLVLIVTILSLAFKSWLDEVRFQANYIWIKATSPKLDNLMNEFDDFDKHVYTVPNMQFFE